MKYLSLYFLLMLSANCLVAQQTNSPDDYKNFVMPDKLAQFPGGEDSLDNFIRKNIVPTPDALKDSIHEIIRVRVMFTITEDGSVTDVAPAPGRLDDPYMQEAIRVVKLMPKWKPAMKNGHPVKFSYMLPVIF